jgi:3-deoxy-D-manno-octulosonic-acid transferase
VQNESDKNKYDSVFGLDSLVAGNLKYSVKQPSYDKKELRKKWGFQIDDVIIAIGSSRPGEEKLLINVFRELEIANASIKLIIAPRHLNRLTEIKSMLKDCDYTLSDSFTKPGNINIINEMGRMSEVYAICDIAIIGGSFYPFGGHNPLEAAFYGKPIIMGPFHSSCLDSVKQLQKAEAILLSDVSKFEDDLMALLKDKVAMQRMGENTLKVFAENSHILQLNLDEVAKCLN